MVSPQNNKLETTRSDWTVRATAGPDLIQPMSTSVGVKTTLLFWSTITFSAAVSRRLEEGSYSVQRHISVLPEKSKEMQSCITNYPSF